MHKLNNGKFSVFACHHHLPCYDHACTSDFLYYSLTNLSVYLCNLSIEESQLCLEAILWKQMYLPTIQSNSWDCPIHSSLSQLLPDTLPDLISDTRSALLRDSLWWEADEEDGSNSDQKHCHLGSFDSVPTQLLVGILLMCCNCFCLSQTDPCNLITLRP